MSHEPCASLRNLDPRWSRLGESNPDLIHPLPLVSITQAEVASWVGSLIGEGLSAATPNRYLSVLGSLLAYAVATSSCRVGVRRAVRVSS